MDQLEVTWWRATKIWWSLLWRGVLYSLAITIPVGMLLGVIALLMGVTEQAEPYFNLIGILIGLPIAIWVVKIVMNKEFSDFKIVLAPSFDAELDKRISTQSE